MVNDSSIVQAARVSYGAGTKKVSEDRGLIRYLLRNYHTTPVEMCEIKLHIKMPMDSWRQHIRHRMASVNEYSTRYSLAIDDSQKTDPNEWRSQSNDNKQGSGANLDHDIGQMLSNRELIFHQSARDLYEERIQVGVAREQARKDLPLSTYTEAYWKIDLHNLLHYLRLRMHHHAQLEIRSYANVIGNEIVAKWCPLVWEAFQDYRLESVAFSKQEKEIMARLMTNKTYVKEYLVSIGWLKVEDTGASIYTNHRERKELEQKLNDMGIMPPW
jgi:thymidylate synthase (FAD)